MEGGGGLCSPMAHAPHGGSTGGGLPAWCRARHEVGPSSVAMLPGAEGIERPIVAAPMASPAPAAIGGRCSAPPVNDRTGQVLI